MDFHLDKLLNLPNVTVFTCYQKEGFNILQLELLSSKVKCAYCENETDEIHQNRPILIRDLSICGQEIYLKVPRRQIYCQHCQKYSTEALDFTEPGRKYTKRVEKQDLKEILNNSPCLSIAYELKEELRDIYETSQNVKMGRRRLQKWLVMARLMFGQTAKTLEKHIQAICHYFLNKTTSGVMEGINNKIKLIIRQSYGFKNFSLLREKLLACLFK